MLFYCLKCRKNTEGKNPKVVKAKTGRIILLSKCSVYNWKKSRFLPTLSDIPIVNTSF